MEKYNLKFKVCSEHKECSFCKRIDIPVVMEVSTGKAICERCGTDLAAIARPVPGDSEMGNVVTVQAEGMGY
jgi:hypothetical protein